LGKNQVEISCQVREYQVCSYSITASVYIAEARCNIHPQCAADVFTDWLWKLWISIEVLTWDTPSSLTVVYILNSCAVNGSTVLVLHEKKMKKKIYTLQ
jgi:hypothetical protein